MWPLPTPMDRVVFRWTKLSLSFHSLQSFQRMSNSLPLPPCGENSSLGREEVAGLSGTRWPAWPLQAPDPSSRGGRGLHPGARQGSGQHRAGQPPDLGPGARVNVFLFSPQHSGLSGIRDQNTVFSRSSALTSPHPIFTPDRTPVFAECFSLFPTQSNFAHWAVLERKNQL